MERRRETAWGLLGLATSRRREAASCVPEARLTVAQHEVLGCRILEHHKVSPGGTIEGRAEGRC